MVYVSVTHCASLCCWISREFGASSARWRASKAEGVDTDYHRVKVNKELGNTIGPFLQNQVLKIRTDVGNSRDYSEVSPEQTLVIGPAV